MQGAATVYLALEIFYPQHINLWKELENKIKIGYYKAGDLKQIKKCMLEQLYKMNDLGFECKASFQKYSTINYKEISTSCSKILSNNRNSFDI